MMMPGTAKKCFFIGILSLSILACHANFLQADINRDETLPTRSTRSTIQYLRTRLAQSKTSLYHKLIQKLNLPLFRCVTDPPIVAPPLTSRPSSFPSSMPSASVLWTELAPGFSESDKSFGTSIALSKEGTSLVVGGTSGSLFLFESGTSIQEDLSLWVKTELSFPFNPVSTIQSCDISNDGNYIAAGEISPNIPGKVLIFENSTQLGGSWQVRGTLSPGVNGDLFGWSVSISDEGDKVIVGAPGANPPYVRIASFFQESDWVFADLESDLDGYGLSVSMSNNGATAAVGATEGNGTVVIYDVDNLLNEDQTMFEGVGNGFGGSVSLSGDGTSVVVGTDNGEYFAIYSLNQIANTTVWEQVGDFTFGTSDASSFGQSIAVSDIGRRIVVGAKTHDVTGSTTLDGKVFIYGTRIIPPKFVGVFSTDTQGNFGDSVAISGGGSIFAVGNPAAGQVRLFRGTGIDE